MLTRRLTAVLMILALIVGTVPGALAAATPDAQSDSIGRTPPRLSYAQGDVSFWRPGAQDWAPAQMNTPLAPGDELYTGHEGNLELQVGGRAFVRAWGDTQLGVGNQEPDYLQIKVTTGHASLDLRTMDPGRTVELDTPHAAFTIERPGYYRVDITQERTSFITRRAGSATMTPAGGSPVTITASEEVVLEGMPTPTVRSYVAPDLDTWDRWNYARTDSLLDAVSARYVPAGVYGVDDLDHHGNWRVVPEYGTVWVPEAVPAGWAPYTAGKWIWDPFYGWTWVDTAPWGWAPYHYGRWVHADGFWAWAPGPIVARPVYAPALVAFFGAPGVRVAVGSPFVSWVALSWGEPLVPWWGRPGFVGRPSWRGWGGPRVVNNVVINRTTVVNVNNITTYRNVNVQNAVVAVPQEHFGRRFVNETRVTQVDTRQLQPVHGALHVAPDAASFVAARGPATRPPETAIARRVVATRPLASPRPGAFREREQGREATTGREVPAAREGVTTGDPGRSRERETPRSRETAATRDASPQANSSIHESATVTVPPARIVSTPPRNAPVAPVQPRPPFGASSIERPRPSAPPRFEAARPENPAVTPPAAVTPQTATVTPPGAIAPRQSMPTPTPQTPVAPQTSTVTPPTPVAPRQRMSTTTPQTSMTPQTSTATPPTAMTPRPQIPATAREQTPAVAPPTPVVPRVETRPAPRADAPVVAPREPMHSAATAVPQPHPMAPSQREAGGVRGGRQLPSLEQTERAQPPARALPGEPANRLYPGRSPQGGPSQGGFNRSAARSSDSPVAPHPRSAVGTPGEAQHGRR